MVGEDTERKNILQGVEIFYELFGGFEGTDHEEACLFIKSDNYSGQFNLAERIAWLKNQLNFDYYPKVVIYNGTISKNLMYYLYDAFDIYLSTSHGEGWDLSAFQMAIWGKKLIVPNHTGYSEYLPDKHPNLYNLHYWPTPVKISSSLMRIYEGSNWHEIVSLDYDDALKEFVNQKVDQGCGEKLSRDLLDQYSIEAVCDKMINSIREIIGK